ncbi:MAG: glycoside hydrolase family 3 N-terminal domain-containing protein [Angelakisella sp.]
MELAKLCESPFFLDKAAIQWVENTLAKMDDDSKLGQLFCLCSVTGDEKEVETLLGYFCPAGVLYRPMPSEKALRLTQALQEKADIPLLIAANLEQGGSGAVTDGTFFASNMAIGATGEVSFAEKLGLVCGREGAAAGFNWAFAPVSDLDLNFRNPITNTRSFGSDPAQVMEMCAAYIRAVQSCGVAAAVKHFPGDGVDERDQHLMPTCNDLTTDEWDASYGKVYRHCIEAGALSVMVGHILQPAWQKRLNPSLTDAELLPASLSAELVNGLLREKLGFQGVVVTDASQMVGFTSVMERRYSLPSCISAGVDMILFSMNPAEDFAYMKDALKSGKLTQQRLNEAVTRILAMKAALGLPLSDKKQSQTEPIGCNTHVKWAADCANRSITLVKKEEGILPISPKRYPRLLLHTKTNSRTGLSEAAEEFKKLLEQEGYTVTCPTPQQAMESFACQNYSAWDLSIYLADCQNKSNQTTVRLNWELPIPLDAPYALSQLPTIFISVGNPYHLLDIPRVKTFINAYCNNLVTLQAIVEKLHGRSPFLGTSPVDVFCGRWDTRQ